jgi:arginine repressor
MAKKKSTKAAAIREALAKQPKASAKDIVKALAARGVKASAAHVYMIKSLSRKKARKAKRAKAVAVSRQAGHADPVALIVEVRRLAEKAGGIRQLKQLVDVLAE